MKVFQLQITGSEEVETFTSLADTADYISAEIDAMVGDFDWRNNNQMSISITRTEISQEDFDALP